MLDLDLKDVKKWLRLEEDETHDDMLIRSLVTSAKTYLYEATGKRKFGEKTEQAKLVCRFLITDWYESRDYNNRTPMAVRKPVITSLILQLKFGGAEDEQHESGVGEPREIKQKIRNHQRMLRK